MSDEGVTKAASSEEETAMDIEMEDLQTRVENLALSSGMDLDVEPAMVKCKNADHCVVHIGEETMECSSRLLCQHSRYFSDRYDTDEPFYLKSITMDTFVLVYSWISSHPTSNVFVLRPNTALRILRAAQRLQMTDLERECMHYLRPTGEITERNAFVVFLEAKRMGDNEFKGYMVSRISSYFLAMVASDEYLSLSYEDVRVILSSNNIRVHCELEVYMAAVRWLNYKWEMRKEDTMHVMSSIRFELISPLHLIEIKYPITEEFTSVIQEPHLQTLTRDALWLSTILHTLGGGDNAMNMSHPLSYYDCTIPPARLWYPEQRLYTKNIYESFTCLLLEHQIESLEEEKKELDEYDVKLNEYIEDEIAAEEMNSCHSL